MRVSSSTRLLLAASLGASLGCSDPSETASTAATATSGDATGTGGATSGPGSGASTGSGGSGGTGAAGGAGGAGGTATCTALLCDDFEGGTLDPTLWTLDAGYDPADVATVEGGMVAHGAYAAHAHLVETQGGFAFLRETTTFPALADALWGRAYFHSTISDMAGHTGLISAFVGDKSVLEIGQSNGTWQLTYYPDSGEKPQGSPTAVPHDAWVCLEWHLDRKGASLIEVYVDGAIVDSYASEGQDIQPLTALEIGIGNHSANPPGNDVRLDDIAIDAARIGCLR